MNVSAKSRGTNVFSMSIATPGGWLTTCLWHSPSSHPRMRFWYRWQALCSKDRAHAVTSDEAIWIYERRRQLHLSNLGSESGKRTSLARNIPTANHSCVDNNFKRPRKLYINHGTTDWMSRCGFVRVFGSDCWMGGFAACGSSVVCGLIFSAYFQRCGLLFSSSVIQSYEALLRASVSSAISFRWASVRYASCTRIWPYCQKRPRKMVQWGGSYRTLSFSCWRGAECICRER